jgi:bzd-type benzoyl-CoA reductase Q subunit
VTEEYRRWNTACWTNPEINWTDGEMITAGVDIGSVSSQAVIQVDGQIYAYATTRTGSSSPNSAINTMNKALEGKGRLTLDKIQYIVGTGYGRVNVPFAQRTITEISCHARGANFMYGPSVRTVLDMGGQDCKVIKCDEKGKVVNFLMNDKCAAGTGRGIEVFSELIGLSIEVVGELSLKVQEEPSLISSMCVVFAKSEASSLLREGVSKEKVLAAYFSAMSRRVVSLLKRIGIEKEFGITGGIAKNKGMIVRLERELGIKSLPPTFDPQIVGALGAAMIAKSIAEKEKRDS